LRTSLRLGTLYGGRVLPFEPCPPEADEFLGQQTHRNRQDGLRPTGPSRLGAEPRSERKRTPKQTIELNNFLLNADRKRYNEIVSRLSGK
jgi:hypothetical protein